MDTSNIVYGKHSLIKRERAREYRREITPPEAKLWERLRARRLNGYHFRRQQIIDGFIADFYCHAAGVIVEVDGEVHENQIEYDALRDRLLRARQLAVLRFTNDQIRERMPAVLDEIAQTIQIRLTGKQQDTTAP